MSGPLYASVPRGLPPDPPFGGGGDDGHEDRDVLVEEREARRREHLPEGVAKVAAG